MSVSIYLFDYRTERFWFADSDDKVTIWKAMQCKDVLNYMEFPEAVAPPDTLVRILIDGNPDLYDVANSLLLKHNMAPKSEEERVMFESYERRRKGLVARGKFFWDMLQLEMSKSVSVPYIFYPMLRCSSSPKQVVDQLLGLISYLPSYAQVLFFALLFKFGPRNRKQVPTRKVPVLQWKPYRGGKQDPLSQVYMQAARGLWAYVDHVKHGNGAPESTMKKQHADWIAWMREQGCYKAFLDTCIDGPNVHKYRRQVSIFKIFIWRYAIKNERSFY